MDIVLMGDPSAGRSSLVKVIFQKMMASQTVVLGITNKMETYEFQISKLQFKIYDFPAKYDLEDPAPNQQMILKNASVLVYVINPQEDTNISIQTFIGIYEYMKERNINNCHFFLFVNKSDTKLENSDAKQQFQLRHKKKLLDEKVNIKSVDFFFTCIFDYSIYQAVSKVVQKVIPCSKDLCRLLNTFATYSKVQKVYMFDLSTKLYIANNSEQLMDLTKYEVCSEIVDIFIEMTILYGKNKDINEVYSSSSVKLSVNEKDPKQLYLMKVLGDNLVLVYTIKLSNYDRPYLIDHNIEIFKKGFEQLFSQTMKSLNR